MSGYKIIRTIQRTEYIEIPVKSMLKIFADDAAWQTALEDRPGEKFNKIHAIKTARIHFNIGLKDAKELVEEFMKMVFGASHLGDLPTERPAESTVPGSSYRSYESEGLTGDPQ